MNFAVPDGSRADPDCVRQVSPADPDAAFHVVSSADGEAGV